MKDVHIPVLRKEVIHYLNLKKGDIIFEGTLGGAGHTVEIIKAIAPTGKVIAVDLDSQALSTAASKLKSLNLLNYIIILNDNFANVSNILKNLKFKYLNGFFLDLGISSYQIELSDRGFSYLKDQGLDMRFSDKTKLSAFDIINKYSEKKLKEIFFSFGQERFSSLIAKNIVKHRNIKPVETTGELVEIINNSIPAKYKYESKRRGNPAKRIFQAIRIEVNSELENLRKAIDDAVKLLVPGGRMVIISYHSLEDRIVKRAFERFSGKCICQPGLPVCSCNAVKLGKIITKKPVVPDEAEISQNPRSKSAKLRVFEKF